MNHEGESPSVSKVGVAKLLATVNENTSVVDVFDMGYASLLYFIVMIYTSNVCQRLSGIQMSSSVASFLLWYVVASLRSHSVHNELVVLL